MGRISVTPIPPQVKSPPQAEWFSTEMGFMLHGRDFQRPETTAFGSLFLRRKVEKGNSAVYLSIIHGQPSLSLLH